MWCGVPSAGATVVWGELRGPLRCTCCVGQVLHNGVAGVVLVLLQCNTVELPRAHVVHLAVTSRVINIYSGRASASAGEDWPYSA